MKLSVREIVTVTGGAFSGDKTVLDTCVTAIVKDNRDAIPGCMFAAIVGENNDGHRYLEAAAENGAMCALVSRNVDCDLPQIFVTDTVEALGEIAEYYRKKFDIPIIGVTGSVGKTTAKEMLYCVLAQKFSVHKTFGNLNNNIGTPLTLFGLNDNHEAAVIEMGISHFGEMARLGKMVRPQMAYFSSIGHAHLEFLGDLNGVFCAKTEMLPFMPEDGTVFINGDDETMKKLSCRQKTVLFGLSKGCEVTAENIKILGDEGMALTITGYGRRIDARIFSFGLHLISAALGAAAVGMHMGLSDEEIACGIAEYAPVGGRSALEKTNRITIINDCYNANPTSAASALSSLAILSGRRIAILGDMMELGESIENRLHRETGEHAAKCGIDLLITTGSLSKKTNEGAKASGLEAIHFESKNALIAALPTLITTGDSVLVKASNSRKFVDIVESLRNL